MKSLTTFGILAPMRLLIIALLVAFSPAQDTEDAATSKVTGAALPKGATRILAKEAAEQAASMLTSAYSKFRFGEIETVYWEGDYAGEKGAALRRAVVQELEKAGHTCKEEATKIDGRDVVLCAVVRDQRRVLGLWICSSEVAMLIWGEEINEFQNVIYSIPPGWTATVSEDAVTLAPGDLLAEERLSVLILSGREFKDDLGASADKLFEEMCREFGVDAGQVPSSSKGEVRKSCKGWEYFHYRTYVDKDGVRLFLDAWFIKVGGRLERVAAITNLVNRDQTPLDSPKYDLPFLRFVHGLRFKNHKDPSLPEGSLSGKGLAGVWVGFGLGFEGRSGDLKYKTFTAAFYTNGQVFFASKLQTFLFEGVDPWLAREITPSYWGTYTFEDGKGVIRMPSGEMPIRMDGEKLLLTRMKTEHKYVRMESVDGTRWDGTYAFEEGSITFGKDGRFRDHGAVKILEHGLYHLYSTGGKPGEGTYEVKNYTLVLNYSDGRRFTTAYLGLLATKGDLRPETLTLGFNDDTLKRK